MALVDRSIDSIQEEHANAVIFKDIDIIHQLDLAVSEAIPEVTLN